MPARRLKAYHYEEDYKVGQMELYINNSWTECYANAYIAEAIACSEYGNHACIYTQGATAEEADSKTERGVVRTQPGTQKRVPRTSRSKGVGGARGRKH